MSMLWQFAKLVAGYDDDGNLYIDERNMRGCDSENDDDHDPIPGSEADMIGPYGDEDTW